MYNVSNIMTEANAIAKSASQTFGGKPSEYLSEALKQAWKEAKAINVVLQKPVKRIVKQSKPVLDIILMMLVITIILFCGFPVVAVVTSFSIFLGCTLAATLIFILKTINNSFKNSPNAF